MNKIYILPVSIIVGVISVIAFVLYLGTAYNAHHQARYAQCEYLGSHIEGGFFGTKIYSYDCNGVVEETTLRPPAQWEEL